MLVCFEHPTFFPLIKTILLIIRDQYRRLTAMAPHWVKKHLHLWKRTVLVASKIRKFSLGWNLIDRPRIFAGKCENCCHEIRKKCLGRHFSLSLSFCFCFANCRKFFAAGRRIFCLRLERPKYDLFVEVVRGLQIGLNYSLLTAAH